MAGHMELPVENLWHQLLNDLTTSTPILTSGHIKDEYTVIATMLNDRTIAGILETWTYFLYDLTADNGRAEPLIDSLKCEERAARCKSLGNEAVAIKDYPNALYLYNKSIMFSYRESEVQQLALSNRALALFKLGDFHGAIRDLKMALASDYPADKIYKVYYRLSQCYYTLGEPEEGADNANKSLNELVERSGLPANNIQAMKIKIEIMMNAPVQPKPPKRASRVGELRGEHEIQRGMSDMLEIQIIQGRGRSVIAKTHIRKGELLFKEEAFASVAVNNHAIRSCDFCCKEIQSQVTCNFCAMCHYCSDACRLASENEYHKLECYGLQIGLWDMAGIARLAFRSFIHGIKKIMKSVKLNTVANAKELLCRFKQELVKDVEYNRVYNLYTNIDMMERSDIKTYAVVAILITYYIRKVCNFSTEILDSECGLNISSKDLNIFIGTIMMKHVCQMVCNSSIIRRKGDAIFNRGAKPKMSVASAIYPSMSMMNHSCVPNILLSYEDKIAIVRAAKDLEPGAEVFNCYGQRAGVQTLQNRRMNLKYQYGFVCKCEACLAG